MSAPASKGTRFATVLNTRDNIAQQIREAQETKKPIEFELESEAKNHSKLMLTHWLLTPMGDEDLLIATSASEEDVRIHIPNDPEKPATAVLPL